MAIYRNVHLSFWTDNKVTDDFTPEDKYFYLYLLTNPHTNLCGCYEFSFKQMSDETGYNKDTIIRLLDRFQNIHKVLMYSIDTKEVLLLNWGKYNWTKSEKLDKPIASQIEKVKSIDFKRVLIDLINERDTVSIPYAYPTDTTDTDTVTDSDSSKKKEIVKRKHEEELKRENEEICNIVDYLNQKLGTKYQHSSKKTQDCIKARLHENFTEDDFYKVIDTKVEEWKGTKLAIYLRPETLFGNKFEGYLNQKPKTEINGHSARISEVDSWV